MKEPTPHRSYRIRRYPQREFKELPVDWRLIEALDMHYAAGNHAGAIRILREFIDQQRHVPVELYFALARLYCRIGCDEQAQAAALSAIAREPGYQEVLSLLGHSLTRTKDFEAAGYYLRLAAALNPQDYTPWARLSNLYTATGNLDATLMAQREAIRRKPHCPMLRRRLSELILFGLDDPP
ncbi:MAG TPA: hypothetical protein PKE26_07695 [Kiritimatiellia bacterium]|nr:hypothetical protein [Kiritimatiellia bacterium]HMO98974.1 hypothetical protein [Kiritimatiellia bacterium]HMP96685.1 hypothetical protein [Kiritimatiellia bacterium]